MLPQSQNNKGIWFILFILTIFLVGNFIFTQYELSQLKAQTSVRPLPTQTQNTTSIDSCGPSCQAFINSAIANQIKISTSSSSTSTGTKTQIIYQQAPAQNQITYVPLSGGNTQNTNWANIPGTSFTLNIGDYGSKAYAIWDANLRVDNANGQTFARLFDTTHNIAVNGSEINISGTSNSTDVVSGALQFWSGNNSYVVQLKSLNGSTAFMDSGRIKISY